MERKNRRPRGRPGERSEERSSGHVAIFCDAGMRFRYPHSGDLAELLARDGLTASVYGPHDPEVAEWNRGRGFAYCGLLPAWGRRLPGPVRTLLFLLAGVCRVLSARVVVATTPTTVPLAFLAALLPGKTGIYYAYELAVAGPNARSAWLQFGLRVLPVRPYLTGPHRARYFARLFRPRLTPRVVSCAALAQTGARQTVRVQTFEDQVVAAWGRRPPVILVVNAGLAPLMYIDALLDAALPRASGVAVVLSGPVSADVRARIETAAKATGNYLYTGILPGHRYDLIRAMRGCDLGWVVKRNDRGGQVNDRTYTPNKLYDFLAAGMPVLCGSQRALDFAVQEGFALRLGVVTPESLRDCLSALAQDPARLAAMKRKAGDAFRSGANFEAASYTLRQEILAAAGTRAVQSALEPIGALVAQTKR